MMDREMLEKAVNEKFTPVYMTNYAQIKDYLQDKHGQHGWVGALAQTISGSEKRSGLEYLRVRRSIERYEAGQFKDMKKYMPQMPKVGQSLPPIGKTLPGNRISITVSGKQYEASGERDRSWTATFTGADAYTFANSPSYYSFFKRLKYEDNIIASFDGDDSSGVDVVRVA